MACKILADVLIDQVRQKTLTRVLVMKAEHMTSEKLL